MPFQKGNKLGLGNKYWLGKSHSTETKEKISNSHIGLKHNEKSKEKLRNFRIGKKHKPETIEKLRISHSKERNINWRGGISYNPYPKGWREDLKEVIRNRDRRKCQLCGKTELEEKRKLQVHHIDYNKNNLNINNLISLCISCHIKTNTKRNYWIKYFETYVKPNTK